MNSLRTLALAIVFGCSVLHVGAQSDSSFASQRALLFADSLVSAFRDNDMDEYLSISYPGVIKYYGGKNQFKEYILRTRAITNTTSGEPHEKCEVIQLVNDMGEWQCVVKKSRQTAIEGKKALIISYLVGQSKDKGNTWKYFDVAYNSVDNLSYIMPDISSALAIPQRQIVFNASFADTGNNHL